MQRWALVLLLCLLLDVAWSKPLTPKNQGYDQGKQAGRREGRERGREHGEIDGEEDGYQAGFVQAQEAYLIQAQTEASQQGQADGRATGLTSGESDGTRLGQLEGEREGVVSGDRSAKDTALKEVSGPARAAGLARAEKADPVADGLEQGQKDGFRRARQTAREQDFVRARQDYYKKQFSAPVEQQLRRRQGKVSTRRKTLGQGPFNMTMPLGRRTRPGCDFRYCSYPSDNEEFQKAYRKGYRYGYRRAYDDKYDWYYDIEFRRALRWGAAQATPGNLEEERRLAYAQAFDEAQAQSYQQALAQAKERAYAEAFKKSFAETYAAAYPQYLEQLYTKVEQEAFDSLYRREYEDHFQRASAESYQSHLPTARKRAYADGWKTEAADFKTRPVRLLDAWVTATEVPHISLLTVRLRNFSDQVVAGHRVTLRQGSESSRLFHDMPAHSEVVVTGALRINKDHWTERDLSASFRRGGQDYPLGKVNIWPEPPTDS